MADGTAHYAEKVGDTQQGFNHVNNLLNKKKTAFNISCIDLRLKITNVELDFRDLSAHKTHHFP